MREFNNRKGFQGIIGHKDIVDHLKNAIQAGRVSHAYLFSGEDGIGKFRLAATFAQTLQCEKGGTEPCGECASCRKMLSGNQPDVIYLTHEKPASIGVDDVRAQLVDDVGIRPYESRYKIYIIDEAEKMTPQAQNAILKTVEEPPSYAVILLLTENQDAMLPTIRSRCVSLVLKPADEAEIQEALMEEKQIPDYQAAVLASYAQGNPGRAFRAADSPEFSERVRNALRLMKLSKRMSTVDLIDAMKLLTEEKDAVYDYLDLFAMWFRDVLMFKATREVDSLIFKGEINEIRERASVSSYEGIQKILKALDTAAVRLRANVNFELVMELLFLTIREN